MKKLIPLLLFATIFSFAEAQNLLTNGDFSSTGGWTAQGDFHYGTTYSNCPCGSPPCYGYAYLATSAGAAGNNLAGSLQQFITLSQTYSSLTLSFCYNATSTETAANSDFFSANFITNTNATKTAFVTSIVGNVSGTTITYTLTDPNFLQSGTTLDIDFEATTDASLPTTMRLDNVSLTGTACPSLATPSSISGTSTINFGQSYTYSISPVSGAVSYTWALLTTSNHTWSPSQTTTSPTVNITWNTPPGPCLDILGVYANGPTGCPTSHGSPQLNITYASTPGTASISANPQSASACTGGSGVVLTASLSNCNNCTYYWSNGMTGSSITLTQANQSGSVYAYAANQYGCDGGNSNSINVGINQGPTINPGSNSPVCAGSDLDLTSSGGGTYSWSSTTGYSSSDPNPVIHDAQTNQSGTYTVTVTGSNTCTASASVSVTVNQPPQVLITNLSNSYCASASTVTLTGSPSGGTFTIDGTTATTLDPSNLSNGPHTVVYSVTQNSCTVTVSQTVTISQSPTVTITASSSVSFCQGGGVTLTATQGTSYLWSTNATSQSIHVTTTGTFNVAVTNPGGCSGTYNATDVKTLVNPNPLVNAGTDTTIQQGGNAYLHATVTGGTPSYHYAWSPTTNLSSSTISNPAATPTTTTPYTVVVTDTNTCTGTDNVTVNVAGTQSCTISPSPAQSPTLSYTGVTDSFTVNVTGTCSSWNLTYSCAWVHIDAPVLPYSGTSKVNYHVDVNPDTISRSCIISLTGGGSYTVQQQANINVVTCNLAAPTVQNTGCVFAAQQISGVSYQWLFNGNIIADATTRFLTATQGNGFYTVSIADNNGCTAQSNDIQADCSTAGIEDITIQHLSILPNPNTGNFSISFETGTAEQVEIKIFDITGHLVKEEMPVKVAGVYSKEINLGNVAKGLYILQLKSEDKILNRQIEVE